MNKHLDAMRRLRLEAVEDRICLAATALNVTVTTGGAEWSISNSTSGPFSTISALGILDAQLTNGGSDAYDGAFILTVDGVEFRDPDGIVDLTGTTVTSGPATLSGLDTTVQYFFDPGSPTVRALFSFTNNTGNEIPASVGVASNLGSDSSTQIETTSDGDANFEPSDRYVITSDGGPSDPVLTFVRLGPDNPFGIPAIAIAPGDHLSGDPSEDIVDVFSINVAPGNTARIMYFGQLAPSVADAMTNAATFDTNAGVQAAGLLDGLTAQQLSEIGNWDFNGNAPPGPQSGTTLPLGSLVLGGNSVTLPLTITTGGAEWSEINNSTSGPFSSPSGLAISDGTLTNGMSDAYDSAFMLAVNGVVFQNPDATFDLNGTTLTSDGVNMSGLTTSVQYFFDPNSPTVRALYSFGNFSGSDIRASATVAHDLGSDSSTIIETTSSGDTLLNGQDGFVITSDGAPFSDPVLTFVRKGPGAVEETPLIAVAPGGAPGVSEDYFDVFDIFVPNEQIRRIMYFGQLSPDAATAVSRTTTFGTNAGVLAAGLLDGLSAEVQAEILNWDFGVIQPQPCSTNVTTTGDPAINASDGVNSLREAIICANETPGDDTITLAAGTYSLTIVGSGEDAAATGDLDVTESLTINGAGAGATIIDAGGSQGLGDRVFHVLGATLAEFQNVTIRGGSGVSSGGGILNDTGNLTIMGSTITGNTANGSSARGGGIYFGGGTATIENSDISGNVADANASSESDFGQGGGIYNVGVQMAISSSTITGNTASAADDFGQGGGIYHTGGSLTISDSTITGNTATAGDDFAQGGGIYHTGGSLTISDSTITGNTATAGDDFAQGGGIYHTGDKLDIESSTISLNRTVTGDDFSQGGGLYNTGGTVTITDSTISGNTATGNGEVLQGGGIYHTGGVLNIIRSTLSGNTALGDTVNPGADFVQGGAIWHRGYELNITNSTISGNSAVSAGTEVYGGGIFTARRSGPLTIESSTITGNAADHGGGGIYAFNDFDLPQAANSAQNSGNGFYYTPEVHNAIIAGNTAANGPDYSGEVLSLGYNLVGDGTGSTGFGATGDKVGTSQSPIDPLLGPLQDNGGPTETHALTVGSPAIDMGDENDHPATDQRGVERPDGDASSAQSGGLPDIGAFEVIAEVIDQADLAIAKGDTPDPVEPGQNLTYVIEVTNNGPDDAVDVVLTDNVPADTTFVSFVAPAGWSATTPSVGGTGTVTANTSSFADGETATFTLVVRVDDDAADESTLANTAVVTAATSDPNQENDAATETTLVETPVVTPQADLDVSKSDSPDPVTPGQELTYTITVINNGPDDAANVVLNDEVPAGTTFVSIVAPAGWTTATPSVGETGTVTAISGTLADGETATFTLVVQVDGDAADDSTITNTATLTSATQDPATENNSATEVTLVEVAPDDPELDLVFEPMMIFEGETATLMGTFPAGSGAHTVTIDWGDGQTTELDLAAGDGDFSADHKYIDENPSGTPQDPVTVTATVTNDVEITQTVVLIVKNRPPFFPSLALNPATVPTGGTTTIAGTYTDPGEGDTHTLDIDLNNDGVFEFIDVPVSGGTFSFDIPVLLAPGEHVVNVQINDDDGASTSFMTTLVVEEAGQVVEDVHLFYNDSAFDGNGTDVTEADSAAIAPDKDPLLFGGTATFTNVSGYNKGINGVFFDVASLPGNGANITAADIMVMVGNDDAPDAWPAGPAPTAVGVLADAAPGGGDRIYVTFANGAIIDTWVRFTIKANANTGLLVDQDFFFGSVPGETGAAFVGVGQFFGRDAADLQSMAQDNLFEPVGPANPNDVNRDNVIDAFDFQVGPTFSQASIGGAFHSNVINAIMPQAGLPQAAFADQGDGPSPQTTVVGPPSRDGGIPAQAPSDQRVGGNDREGGRELAFAAFDDVPTASVPTGDLMDTLANGRLEA